MAAPTLTSQLLIKRLSPHATLPTRGSAFAAGLDLYAAEPKQVPARGKALVDLGLSMSIPLGTYGRIAPRSGLASKHSLSTGAGVIDADYRGPIFVLLFNHSDVDYEVPRGERVAQLILEKCEYADVAEVEELEATVRGSGGFGSTGGFGASAAAASLASTAAAAAAAVESAVAGAGAAVGDGLGAVKAKVVGEGAQ